MAGSLDGRLNRAESEFGDKVADFLETEDGDLVYIGSTRIVEDFLDLMQGEELEDERARLYADALDDGAHGSALDFIIRTCQERYREER